MQTLQNKILRFLFLILLGNISLLGYAQSSATEGKEFYLSFGRNYEYDETPNSALCQVRFVVTQTTQVTAQYNDGTYIQYKEGGVVIGPINNYTFIPGIYTVEVDKTKCYIPTFSSGVSNLGIKITSTENIGVFALNLAVATTDATTVLPVASLGNHYTMLSHSGITSSKVAGVSILVVAPNDGTVFTIKNAAGGVVVNNQALNARQTYVYTGTSADLSGYTVESNYNVAVYTHIGCGSAITSGGCDMNFEQMWPTNTAGKDYLVFNMSPSYADEVKIIALDDNTKVTKTVNGQQTETTMSKHGVEKFKIDPSVHTNASNKVLRINADKPIIVGQNLGWAPALKWLSPIEQRITEAAISPFIPTGSSVIENHYMYVMIPVEAKNDMVVKETRSDGTTNVTLNFVTNVSDPNYIIAQKQYQKTDNVLIEMFNPKGFIAYMVGVGGAESYIFTAGAGAFNLQAYYTIGTSSLPQNDTYYSATSAMTHSFEETANIPIKRTIEKSFTSVKWYVNGTQYTVAENTNTSNSWTLPASVLKPGENEITMAVRYTGTPADELYIGKVWLSAITDYPDNISDNLKCVKEAEETVWGIVEAEINKTDMVHNYGPLVTGDIDNDGKVEIIGLTPKEGSQLGYDSDGIILYNYEDGKVKKKNSFTVTRTQVVNGVSTTGSSTASFGAIAIARYNDEGYIVLAGTNKYLYAYNPAGVMLWRSDQVYDNDVVKTPVNIADFDGDGIPEVYVANKIFSLANGKLLADGGTANNKGTMSSVSGFSPMAIDVDLDSKNDLELVAGTQIYKATLTNKSGTSGNSLSVITDLELPAAKIPANALKDGITQVVDIDNDGSLEVVVTSINASNRAVVYVWKPQPNGESYIVGSYLVPATSVSYTSIPMIGDIDNDGYPEIVFITNGSLYRMYALKYDPNAAMGNRLKLKWQLTHSDGSGCTGMSMFDFNLDGTAEIVYRDQTELRIIDGSPDPVDANKTLVHSDANKTFTNVLSHTLREYPVIADLDKDGQAEIVVTGWDGVTGGIATPHQNNFIRVFKSSGTQWAPARTVWNQYNYNSVNVNEDLTIPAKQFPITTKFKGKDKTAGTADDIRVYNNFRQQQTYLDKNGVPYMKIANAVVVDANNIVYSYDMETDKLTVSNLKVENQGEASLKAPLKITTYKDAVGNPKKQVYSYNTSIKVGAAEAKTISFTISDFSTWMPVNKLIVKVNDAGTGFNDQDVCDSCCVDNESGSFASIPFNKLAWADSYRKCETDNVVFTAATLPGTNVAYKWFMPNGITSVGTTKEVTKSNLALADAGKYVFQAEKVNGNISFKYVLPYLSVAPKVMYWRADAEDSNWNNINNWANSKTLGDNIKAVPSSCTDVHIPGVSRYFPSLDTDTTDYSIYGDPTVNTITYHYGGETAYPHNLKYNKAYVRYNWGYYGTMSGVTPNSQPNNNEFLPTNTKKKRGQWYALSAPLKKMASGDFSFGGYPMSYQALFNMPHPVSGNIQVGDFSKSFAANDIDLSTTNNAVVVKVGAYDNKIGYNDHKNLEGLQGVLEIPYFENDQRTPYHTMHNYDHLKQESKFYYFNTNTLQVLHSPIGTMKRGDEAYRFIYEKDNKETPTISSLGGVKGYTQNVKVKNGASQKVMIGNPFMASINSGKFYTANSQLDQIINFAAGYEVFSSATQQWIRYSFNDNNHIGPLQAFLVTLENGKTDVNLVYPLEGTYALTGAGKRGMVQRMPAGVSLFVKAKDTNDDVESDYAILELTNTDESELNVQKMIYPEGHTTPEIFFVDESKDYNLIQYSSRNVQELPLGVKSSQKGKELTLTFENVEDFANSNGVRPVLVDKELGRELDLLKNSSYTFTQRATDAKEQYSDNKRFVLRLVSSATSGNSELVDNGTKITYHQQELRVSSSQIITKVSVYDLYGRLVYNKENLNVTDFSEQLSLLSGVYVVKVKMEEGKVKVGKIAVL